MSLQKILITGAGGFVGSNLTRHYLSKGNEVHAVVHDKSRLWRIADIADSLHVYESDLSEPDAAKQVVESAEPEIILHFAAHAALPNEPDEREVFTHTVYPLINLATAVAIRGGCKVFVNAGSSSEYGYQTEPMREDTLPNPTRVHDIAKLAQTLYGVYAARFKELPIVNLRLFSVYGPFEHGRRLIPNIMKCALLKQQKEFGSPDVVRDFIYVDDVVAAIDHCLESGRNYQGEIYNLGTGVESSIRDAVELVKQIHGKPMPVVLGAKPRNRWDSPRWVADTTRQKNEFGFGAKTTLREGLEKTYQWFKENIGKYGEYAA